METVELTKQPQRKWVSLEGIALSEYHWVSLILCAVPAVFLCALVKITSFFTRETNPDISFSIPSNSIVFLYHTEQYTSGLCWGFWKRFMRAFPNHHWLGFHGWLSYVGSLWPALLGARAFRYDRRKPERPFEQVLTHLHKHPKSLFMLRTDSGGPYEKVRDSLVRLSLQTGRPLVGIRQTCTKKLTIAQHYFPLPFAKVQTRFTRIFLPEEFESVALEKARETIQEEMDAF